FMRVDDSSPLEELARQAAFGHFAAERIFRRPAGTVARAIAPAGLRPRRGSDHHGLFQLYSSLVPGRVRQVAAMTMQEWRLIDGWHRVRMRWTPGIELVRRDVVIERDGTLLAWLQLNRRRSMIRFLARPEFNNEIDRLIAWGIGMLDAPKGCLCP